VTTWFCWRTLCDQGSPCEQRCWLTKNDCEGDRWQPWASTTDLVQEPCASHDGSVALRGSGNSGLTRRTSVTDNLVPR
jgi:hypothetical protein